MCAYPRIKSSTVIIPQFYMIGKHQGSMTADAHTTNPEGLMCDMGKRVMQSERETCAPFVGAAVDILHLLSVHWGARRLTNPITHNRNWTIKKK